MISTPKVQRDPEDLLGPAPSLDRGPYEALVRAVLAWKSSDLDDCDHEQIALQMTEHARVVAADVRHHALRLPDNDGRRALAEVVLGDADRILAEPLEATAACVQDRARLVRALYARLDRLTAAFAPPA
ncbi:restriction endonuclease [Streptomyces sp. NPDC051577]|uniref:restriction endonuclease n=1 Tax=Streptomyces sp. NPDC051577 TaxID=3155166 RepID=UPI00343E8675